MVAFIKNNATPKQIQHLISWLKRQDLIVHISTGESYTLLGLIGDTKKSTLIYLKDWK